jgi:hypothetical protein
MGAELCEPQDAAPDSAVAIINTDSDFMVHSAPTVNTA